MATITRCDGTLKGDRFCFVSLDGELFVGVSELTEPLDADDVAALKAHIAGDGQKRPMMMTRQYLRTTIESAVFSEVETVGSGSTVD